MNRRKPLPTNENLKKYAVEMRKKQTDEEKKVWYQILKGRTPKFHGQRIIGNYIVDFYCPQLRLAIEIDGYQHFYEENIEYDSKRLNILKLRISIFCDLKIPRLTRILNMSDI